MNSETTQTYFQDVSLEALLSRGLIGLGFSFLLFYELSELLLLCLYGILRTYFVMTVYGLGFRGD